MTDINTVETMPLEHIIGLEQAKEVLQRELRLRSVKDQPQKMIMLEGQSGSCKTTLIEAMIKEYMNITPNRFDYHYLDTSEVSAHVSSTAEKIQGYFGRIRQRNKHAILFIDECDELMSTRKGAGHIRVERTVNMIKALNNPIPNLLIICATNRPYQVDTAIRERCIDNIHCPYPTDSELKQIMDIQLDMLTVEQRKVLHAYILYDMQPKPKDKNGKVPEAHTWSGRDIKKLRCKFLTTLEYENLTHTSYKITNQDITKEFQYITNGKNNMRNDYLD